MMTIQGSRFALAAVLILLLPALQGCFPIAAVGMTASAMIASDRRGVAGQAVDQEIEHRIDKRFNKELTADAHVNVVSFNRLVLLTGEVPNETERALAESIANEMPFSPKIINELRVGGASYLRSRADDALVTSAVKTRLARGDVVSPTHVKVVTEARVVYLMGLLTEREARSAIEIASTTADVAKVVNLVQLINEPPSEPAANSGPRPSTVPLPATPAPVSPGQRPQRM